MYVLHALDMFSIFERSFGWEKTPVKYLSLFGLNTTHFLYRCHQLSFLRLFAPRMLPKMNINGNKGKIALGKKETFKVLKGTHFIWYRILLSYKLNMYLKWMAKDRMAKNRAFEANILNFNV